MYKGRLVLSSKSVLLHSILQMYHDSVLGGHSGFLQMYKGLAEELFWKGMKVAVKSNVDACQVCKCLI